MPSCLWDALSEYCLDGSRVIFDSHLRTNFTGSCHSRPKSSGNAMRIMYVCNLFPPIVSGGAEISTATLARAVANRGDDVRVFTLRPDESHAEILNEGSIEIHRSTSNLPYWPFDKV